jgi:hypothetical protein
MPIKSLIENMCIIATQRNYKFFNLRNGLGERDDDSLFKFKFSFSFSFSWGFKKFYLWKLIINQELYNQLDLKKGMYNNTNYFPLYSATDDLNVNL